MTKDQYEGLEGLLTACPNVGHGINYDAKSQHGHARFAAYGPAADVMFWLYENRDDLITAARERDKLIAENRALREAMEELTTACEADFGVPGEWDEDAEAVGASIDSEMAVKFGHLRKASAALTQGAAHPEQQGGQSHG